MWGCAQKDLCPLLSWAKRLHWGSGLFWLGLCLVLKLMPTMSLEPDPSPSLLWAATECLSPMLICRLRHAQPILHWDLEVSITNFNFRALPKTSVTSHGPNEAPRVTCALLSQHPWISHTLYVLQNPLRFLLEACACLVSEPSLALHSHSVCSVLLCLLHRPWCDSSSPRGRVKAQ